jgi:histidinol-phosphate aminotransferase
LGIAIAQAPLIQILANAKAPYNVSGPTAHLALAALTPPAILGMREKIQALIRSRGELLKIFATLAPLGLGNPIGANEANFILIPILDGPGGKPDNHRAQTVYRTLAEEKGVVIRYRGGEPGCLGCVRITVGSNEENEIMINRLKEVLTSTLNQSSAS